MSAHCEYEHCQQTAEVVVRRVTDEEGDLVGDPPRWRRIIYQTVPAGDYCYFHADRLCGKNHHLVYGEDL